MTRNKNANPYKAKRIIDQLAKGEPMTYNELAAATGMPKGTVITTMQVLVAKGEVIQDPAPKELKHFSWVFKLPPGKPVELKE